MYGTGLGSPGVVIEIPLTSTLLLVMFEKSSFADIIDRSMEIIEDEEKILDVNTAIINNANKIVFAENRELVDIAVELCNENPGIKKESKKMLVYK